MHQRDFITPRQLAAAIGVSESSLKRWTDKGLLPVNKTAGGHRRIPLTHVVQFLRTTRTPLANPEILGLRSPLDFGPVTSVSATAAIYECLRSGDGASAASVLMRCYLAEQSVAAICDLVIQPAMAAIGEEWARGQMDVFEEHRATQMCVSLLAVLRRLLPDPPNDAPVAVGGAGPDDPYLIATAMVQLALTEMGFRAVNLGANTPLESLERAARTLGARVAWLSVSEGADPERLFGAVDTLAAALDARKTTLILGGRVLDAIARDRLRERRIGDGMGDLPKLVNGAVPRSIHEADDFVGM